MRKICKEQLVELCRLGHTQREIAEHFGANIRTVERTIARLREQGIDLDTPLAGGTDKAPDEEKARLNGGLYIITCAQNNTFADKDFVAAIEKYAELNGGEILVSTFTYAKNEYQRGEKDDSKIWYDPSIVPYIYNESSFITDDLALCAELNISPTAERPLSGLDNYTNTASAIVPHPKLIMKSLATPKHMDARLMYTTGTVTLRNYIQKKAGQKASHHHCLGALVVEVDKDGKWFVRQIEYDKREKGFYDLDKWYSREGVITDCRVEGINYGDIHAAKITPQVSHDMWLSESSPMEVLMPKYVMLHDVHDQQARNHHNVKDPHFMFKMHAEGKASVVEEVKLSASVINEFRRDWCQVVVVESNHDLALEKWLKEQDYRNDPENAIFFLQMQLAKYESIVQQNSAFSIFEHACLLNGLSPDGVIFLREDDSFVVAGNEMASHGHLGNNGSRGSLACYVKTGVMHVLGHSHSAGREAGVKQSGVCVIEQGYNKGNGSHSVTHVVTYQNGKSTLITMRGSKWKGEDLR